MVSLSMRNKLNTITKWDLFSLLASRDAEMPIIAKGRLGQHDIEAEVLNPSSWFGKTWLIEIGCGFSSSFFAVEADTVTDAIDEFSGSATATLS